MWHERGKCNKTLDLHIFVASYGCNVIICPFFYHFVFFLFSLCVVLLFIIRLQAVFLDVESWNVSIYTDCFFFVRMEDDGIFLCFKNMFIEIVVGIVLEVKNHSCYKKMFIVKRLLLFYSQIKKKKRSELAKWNTIF